MKNSESYTPTPLREVWEWKEKSRSRTLGLSTAEVLARFRKQVEPLIKQYNLAPTDTPCRIAEDATEYQKPNQ